MAASSSGNNSEINISQFVAQSIFSGFNNVTKAFNLNEKNQKGMFELLDEIRCQNDIMISLLCRLSGVSPSDIPEYDRGVSLEKKHIKKKSKKHAIQ
jgi:hypothetical protein